MVCKVHSTSSEYGLIPQNCLSYVCVLTYAWASLNKLVQIVGLKSTKLKSKDVEINL